MVSELNQSEVENEPGLITARELARLLRVSTRTLARLRRTGDILCPIRLGGSVRWRMEEVRRWISEGCPRSP